MKKGCITFLLSGIIMVAAVCAGVFSPSTSTPKEFLRIHIRAHSDEEEAQSLKYLVRDALVDYLTPLASTANSKDEATALIQERALELEEVANAVLLRQFVGYTARVFVRREEFPFRTYGEVSLEAGVYDAVIVELGEAKGQNWWCVVYPPLCFAGEGGVKYKSLILEKIAAWRRGT